MGKTVKKFTVLLALALMAALGLTACSKKSDDPPPEESGPYIGTVRADPGEGPVYSAPADVNMQGYTTYYFDGDNGNDASSGTELAPKKSLEEVKNVASQASIGHPIRILLKRGTTFKGCLVLSHYEATEEKPLILSAYGASQARPVLVGEGRMDTDKNIPTETAYPVVRLMQGNVRVSGLEITDRCAYQGILLLPERRGALKNVVIEDCYVHDINFFWPYSSPSASGVAPPQNVNDICPEFQSNGTSNGRYIPRSNGGIVLSNDTPEKVGASWLENVYVLNNCIENVSRTGIYVVTRWNNRPGVGYGNNLWVDDSENYNDAAQGIGLFQHKNIAISYNKLDVIGGDGIVLGGADDSFLEHNVCYHANYLARAGYYNAAIWVYSSRNVLYRYNEAAYTYLRNGAGDGEGLDIDNSCSRIFCDYNYSHHNEGGGILVCNNRPDFIRYNADGTPAYDGYENPWGDWKDNFIRNNVFAYNGNADETKKSAFMTVARQTDRLQVYNNTVIVSGDIPNQHIIDCEDIVACRYVAFYNNIFYAVNATNAVFDLHNFTDFEAGNNVFVNLTGGAEALHDKSPITLALSWNAPAEMKGYDCISGYAFTETSVYTGGMQLKYALNKDALGRTNAGAYVGALAKAD